MSDVITLTELATLAERAKAQAEGAYSKWRSTEGEERARHHRAWRAAESAHAEARSQLFLALHAGRLRASGAPRDSVGKRDALPSPHGRA